MTAVRFAAATALALSAVLTVPGLRAQQQPQPKPEVTPYTAQGMGQPPVQSTVALQSVGPNQTLHMQTGQSLMMRSDTMIKRIYVGNPAVLQSFTASPKEFVLTAKTAGISSLVVWDAAGKSTLYTISADLDPAEARQSLAAAYPDATFDVQGTGDRLMLSGTVSTPEAVDAAGKLAGVYSKEVVNSLRVAPRRVKQVELRLRIVEVDRTKLEQLGFNIFVGQGTNIGSITTQQFPSTITASGGTASASDPLNAFFYNFTQNVGITVKDLEQRDVLQVLAEPTLTTVSGVPAHFISGGEFPFPVAQGGTGSSTAIAIQFKSYGIKVDFMPLVNPDGSIHLKVTPEVSTLDYSNAVVISGFTVPALATKRAEQEVELRSGQTFMLSGLLDHRTTEIMSRMPGIGSIPVLGQLFRSKNNSHSVTELVVLATVTVVDPLTQDQPGKWEPKMVVPNLDAPTFDRHLQDGMPKDKTQPNPAPAPSAPAAPAKS